MARQDHDADAQHGQPKRQPLSVDEAKKRFLEAAAACHPIKEVGAEASQALHRARDDAMTLLRETRSDAMGMLRETKTEAMDMLRGTTSEAIDTLRGTSAQAMDVLRGSTCEAVGVLRDTKADAVGLLRETRDDASAAFHNTTDSAVEWFRRHPVAISAAAVGAGLAVALFPGLRGQVRRASVLASKQLLGGLPQPWNQLTGVVEQLSASSRSAYPPSGYTPASSRFSQYDESETPAV